MRPHSRAAHNKEIARAPNAFRQHLAAAVSRLAEPPQLEPAGREGDHSLGLRRAFRARKPTGRKHRKMRDRASPPHPKARLPCARLAHPSRWKLSQGEMTSPGYKGRMRRDQ